jgi:predicted nucleic acid-binding protein
MWTEHGQCARVQVLQELFVTVTRKVAKPLSVEEAAARVREVATWRIFVPTAQDVIAAIGIHRDSRLAFWDAMIVLAASESGCDILWTEDLSAAPSIRGVRIRNPFE